LVLGCLARKLVDLVFVQSLLLLELIYAALSIGQREGQFLQFEIFHIGFNAYLSKFLLDSHDHFLHMLLVLQVLTHHFDVRIELLVQLLGVR